MESSAQKIRPSSVAEALPEALPEPTPATRAQYQHALLVLPRAWPVLCARTSPEISSDAYVVLTQLLDHIPGLVTRQAVRVPDPRKSPGLAELLGWKRPRFVRALAALRLAGVLVTVIYEDSRPLPYGQRRKKHVRMCRYFVNTRLIEEAAQAAQIDPSDGPINDPSTGSQSGRVEAPTPNPSRRAARRPPRTPPPSASQEAAAESRRSAQATRSGSANPHDLAPQTESESTGGKEQNEDHDTAPPSGDRAAPAAPDEDHDVETLVREWDALRMPEEGGRVSVCRPSERSAIRNRLREAGLATIRLAMIGAAADTYITQTAPRRCAIAWVFASRKGVEQYSSLGARASEQKAQAARAAAAAEAERVERDALAREAAETARSPEGRKAARVSLAQILAARAEPPPAPTSPAASSTRASERPSDTDPELAALLQAEQDRRARLGLPPRPLLPPRAPNDDTEGGSNGHR